MKTSLNDDAEQIKRARKYAEDIVETVREPLLVLDSELKVLSANKSFFNIFKVSPKGTIGRFVYDLGNGQWNIPELRKLLEEILPENNFFEDYEIEHDFETIGKKTMLLNARRLDSLQIILLAIEDVTAREKNVRMGEMNELMMNREEKILELKKEIEELKKKLNGA